MVQRLRPFDRDDSPSADEAAHAERWAWLRDVHTPIQKRRNHYVPVFLLSGWQDVNGTLAAVTGPGRHIVTAPHAVAHEIDLDTVP